MKVIFELGGTYRAHPKHIGLDPLAAAAMPSPSAKRKLAPNATAPNGGGLNAAGTAHLERLQHFGVVEDFVGSMKYPIMLQSLVYLPTFSLKSRTNVGKYTIH